jgi:hypothetical protein
MPKASPPSVTRNSSTSRPAVNRTCGRQWPVNPRRSGRLLDGLPRGARSPARLASAHHPQTTRAGARPARGRAVYRADRGAVRCTSRRCHAAARHAGNVWKIAAAGWRGGVLRLSSRP